MFNNRVPHILDGDYAPKSAVDIFVKDLGIVLETGKGLTFPLPLTATAHQQFLAASAGGLGRQDDSAVITVFQKLTGIDLPSVKSLTSGRLDRSRRSPTHGPPVLAPSLRRRRSSYSKGDARPGHQ